MVASSPEQAFPAGPVDFIGRIVSVTGAHAVVKLTTDDAGKAEFRPPEIGSLLKFELGTTVFGIVTALHVTEGPSHPNGRHSVEIEFVGEIVKGEDGRSRAFRRGVTVYPTLGDPALPASTDDIGTVYHRDSQTAIRIGTISKASSVPAMVEIDDLLGKHVAVLGSTGTGKSCATALLLRRIIEKAPQAHIILLDSHNEYAAAFGDLAEVITPDTFQLPFWMLEFEELSEVLIGPGDDRHAEIEILREMIPLARLRFGSNQRRDRLLLRNQVQDGFQSSVSVNTPIPYRISDLVALLDEAVGRLELRGAQTSYKRLKARIEFITRDPRFSFMFGSLTVQDNMAGILSQLFRIPVAGKPIALVELGHLPSEVLNVVVSVLARLTFDFGTWGGGHTPIALVCEEAHRFAPANRHAGFAPTQRALARIAREGRKYGLSLVVVSQRPSELDQALLSQCSTVFTMRLTNERDQHIVRAGVNDATSGLLAFLPSMGTGEAAIFGEGAALPARIRFDWLSEDNCPRSAGAAFSSRWSSERTSLDDLDELVRRWRSQGRGELAAQSLAPQLARALAEAEAVALPSHARAAQYQRMAAEIGANAAANARPADPLASAASPAATSPAATSPSMPPQPPLTPRIPLIDPVLEHSPAPPPGGTIDWRKLRMKIIESATADVARKKDSGNGS